MRVGGGSDVAYVCWRNVYIPWAFQVQDIDAAPILLVTLTRIKHSLTHSLTHTFSQAFQHVRGFEHIASGGQKYLPALRLGDLLVPDGLVSIPPAHRAIVVEGREGRTD